MEINALNIIQWAQGARQSWFKHLASAIESNDQPEIDAALKAIESLSKIHEHAKDYLVNEKDFK